MPQLSPQHCRVRYRFHELLHLPRLPILDLGVMTVVLERILLLAARACHHLHLQGRGFLEQKQFTRLRFLFHAAAHGHHIIQAVHLEDIPTDDLREFFLYLEGRGLAEFSLLHRLYLLFDEGNLLLVKTVFGVKLTVNIRNGFRPVNVTLRREILHGDF